MEKLILTEKEKQLIEKYFRPEKRKVEQNI